MVTHLTWRDHLRALREGAIRFESGLEIASGQLLHVLNKMNSAERLEQASGGPKSGKNGNNPEFKY